MSRNHERILIIGTGATGLGSARTLQLLGHERFLVVDRSDGPGGLGASFIDGKGFVWDFGTHIHFLSRAEYRNFLEESLGGEQGWRRLPAAGRIWTHGRLIPYPFQLNLRHLPAQALERCLMGLFEAEKACRSGSHVEDLECWIRSVYGSAIAADFLIPYCRKALSYEPSGMSVDWALKRFPPADTAGCIDGILSELAAKGAVDSHHCVYPVWGGNGAVWRRLAERLRERIVYSKTASRLETRSHTVWFSDGTRERYDKLISTMPLDRLVADSDCDDLKAEAKQLKYSSVNVIGFGLRGAVPPILRDVGWVYCAQEDIPFYRMTVLSNLSPRNVPDPDHQWSLLMETSCPPDRVPSEDPLIQAHLAALAAIEVPIHSDDISHTWSHTAAYAYPVPSIGRESVIENILGALRDRGVYSCGRFGAWHYENSNQDECFSEGAMIAAAAVRCWE